MVVHALNDGPAAASAAAGGGRRGGGGGRPLPGGVSRTLAGAFLGEIENTGVRKKEKLFQPGPPPPPFLFLFLLSSTRNLLPLLYSLWGGGKEKEEGLLAAFTPPSLPLFLFSLSLPRTQQFPPAIFQLKKWGEGRSRFLGRRKEKLSLLSRSDICQRLQIKSTRGKEEKDKLMLPEHEKERGKEKRRDAKWSGGIFLFSKACMKNGRSLSRSGLFKIRARPCTWKQAPSLVYSLSFYPPSPLI